MAVIKKYQKKDGTFAYKFNAYLGVDPVTGKSIRTTRRGFKTQKEANLALARLTFNVADSGFQAESKLTYEQVYKMWLEQHKLSVRASTVENTQKRFKTQILPKFGKLRIAKIDTHACQLAVNEWSEKIVAASQLRGQASKVFDYAVRNNIISSNPMKRTLTTKNQAKAKKNERKEKTKDFYSKEELKFFFECLEKEQNMKALVYFRLLAFTGARKGEINALTWEDIDLSQGKITINKTLVVVYGDFKIHPTKTKNSVRTISLDDATIALLRKWKRHQKEWLLKTGRLLALRNANLVFTNDQARKGNDYLFMGYGQEVIKTLSRKYGVEKIKIHGFRHTHASLLFESGATIKDVQMRLGHADVKTTLNVYTHVTKDREEETANQFAKYVNF